MFKVNAKRELFYPIKLSQLKDDGSGEVNTITIKIKYKLLTRKEMQDLVAHSKKEIELAAINNTEIDELLKDDEKSVLERITDWQGIVDYETGKEIPFSQDALLAVMEESHEFAAKVVEGLYFASRDLPVKN